MYPSSIDSISRHLNLQVTPKREKKKGKKKRWKKETHHSPQPSLDTSIQTLLDFPTSSVGGCVTRKLPVSPAGPPSFGYYLAPQVLR